MTTTIRMGAAHYDVTVAAEKGPLHFDLRSMNNDERRHFHKTFMEAYREVTGTKHTHRRRRRKLKQ